MAIRQLKPVTPASRFTSRPDFSEITTDKPEKSLVRKLKKTGGRNNKGRITSRRRGGGHKRSYRIIDFKRNKFDIEGKVATIEYDPNRSAFIALIHYIDGEKRYIIQPDGLKVGDKIKKKLFNTKVIHAGHKEDKETGSVMPPIHLSSTFKQKSPGDFKYEYARTNNPTREILEKLLKELG